MKEEKDKIIDNFLKQLKDKHTDGEFGLFCKKCGSFNIESSYGGNGHCVATGSYTAEFDGEHSIKCLDCGNATTNIFYVSLNGICD